MYRELTAEWREALGPPGGGLLPASQSRRVLDAWAISFLMPVLSMPHLTAPTPHPSIHPFLSQLFSLSPFPSIYLSHLCLSVSLSLPVLVFHTHLPSSIPFLQPSAHSPLQPPLLCPFPAGALNLGVRSSPQPHPAPSSLLYPPAHPMVCITAGPGQVGGDAATA